VLQIKKIVGSLPYGNSKPIKIIADDNKTYILKFRKDHLKGKDRSNTNEYIAYKLIEHFKMKIAPQKLKLIEIDDLAITLAEKSSISKESLTYFKASKGFISVDKKDIEGIRKIIESIPAQWETHYCDEEIIAILTSRVQNKIK